MLGRRKPSLLIVLVLLFAVVHSEFPELVHLRDDVSNDFTVSACASQPVQSSAACDTSVPLTCALAADAIPGRTFHGFRFPTAATPRPLAIRLNTQNLEYSSRLLACFPNLHGSGRGKLK